MLRPRSLLAAVVATGLLAGCSTGGSGNGSGSGSLGPVTSPAPVTAASTTTTSPSSAAPSSSAPPLTTATATPRSATPHTGSTPPRSSPPSARSASIRRHLPVPGTTGGAQQAITVVASSASSTIAQLQAWNRVAGGWRRIGQSIIAHLGSGGIGRASEGSTRTPAGSFTLTQAFGHDSDPGTRLPYVRTTPDDWWISQSSSPLYNTRQRCASRCSFTRGDPNEHLYYETPFYDYAVVIDYNTANAPGGVTPGAGSAFFLHVTDGRPTAGCVSIPQDRLVTILRWLRSSEHPRILIGVA